jgi:hypothetical protein
MASREERPGSLAPGWPPRMRRPCSRATAGRSTMSSLSRSRSPGEDHGPARPSCPRRPVRHCLGVKFLSFAFVVRLLSGLSQNAPLAIPVDGGPGWDDTNFETAFDSVNQCGRSPGNRLPPAELEQTSLKASPPSSPSWRCRQRQLPVDGPGGAVTRQPV